MEPGGDDEHASYEAWHALGAGELIDCREHHLWKRDVLGEVDATWTQWHEDRSGTKTQPTWRRLIQLLFGFEGKDDLYAEDLQHVYDYQKHQLGRADAQIGETALVELGALNAPGLATPIDRITHREQRIATLAHRLTTYKPTFAVCYGYKFEEQFEAVVGREFDNEGFRWRGSTLCVLVPGPTSHLKGRPTPWASPAWWIEKGRAIRSNIDSRTN